MEQIRKHLKGRLQFITIEVLLILTMTFLIHYIFNGEIKDGLPDFKFPQSLSLATLLRLSFFQIKSF